jgi:hypothetical protein
MRSYNVYGAADGNDETYIATVQTVCQRARAEQKMRSSALFDTMIVRNVVGNEVVHRKDLTGADA